MERYSGTQASEAMPVDPAAGWAAEEGETGLEEHMWQLGLGGGPESYPERPDEPDCIYYLRTGFCGYGDRCRFNHPPDRSAAMGALRTSGDEYPERTGQPVCQLRSECRTCTCWKPGAYYMRTGMCKFGSSCKYHHPKNGVGSPAPIPLNFYGYPLRPGEKECSYYIKSGQCKFGVTCKFHHPQPTGIQVPPPPSVPAAMPTTAIYPNVHSSQQYGLITGNWPVTSPTMLPGSYVPGSYGSMLFPPGVVPIPGWTPYPANTQPTFGAGPIYGMNQLSPSSTAYAGSPYLPITSSSSSSYGGPSSSSALPERHGQPECQYYLRTGDCKFGSTCKYHHPPEWTASKTNFVLGPSGLPLRPGAPLCSHYAQSGLCRFGAACKFDHPLRSLISYSPSASSLTDMPVAPYPVGSTNTTLAPSSSSSDLRPENILSGLSKDSLSSQMSSSANSSSASVGSTFSKSAATK